MPLSSIGTISESSLIFTSLFLCCWINRSLRDIPLPFVPFRITMSRVCQILSSFNQYSWYQSLSLDRGPSLYTLSQRKKHPLSLVKVESWSTIVISQIYISLLFLLVGLQCLLESLAFLSQGICWSTFRSLSNWVQRRIFESTTDIDATVATILE